MTHLTAYDNLSRHIIEIIVTNMRKIYVIGKWMTSIAKKLYFVHFLVNFCIFPQSFKFKKVSLNVGITLQNTMTAFTKNIFSAIHSLIVF